MNQWMLRLIFNSIAITLLLYGDDVSSSFVYCFDWSIRLMSRAKKQKQCQLCQEMENESCTSMLSHTANLDITEIRVDDSNRYCNSFCKLWIRNEGEFLSRTLRAIKTKSSSGWKIKYYLIIKANTQIHFPLILFCKHLWKSTKQFLFLFLI